MFNYSSFTAIILTIHHQAALLALVVATVLSLTIYALLLKNRGKKALAIFITLVATFFIGVKISEQVFKRKALKVEVIKT